MPLENDINWDKVPELDTTQFQGYNANEMLFARLRDWSPEHEFGGADINSVNEWRAARWLPLEMKHFGVKNIEDFNKKVALRFDLRVDQTYGFLMNRDNVIMYTHAGRRSAEDKARMAAYKASFDESPETQAANATLKSQFSAQYQGKVEVAQESMAEFHKSKSWNPLPEEK